MFKNIIRIMPGSWPISVACGGVAGVICSCIVGVEWPRLAISMMSAMFGTAIALNLLRRYEAGLTARVMEDAPFVWDVWLNDIRIGVIFDSEYAAMQRDAIRDARLILAQWVNLGYVGLNVAANVCAMMPRLTIWFAAVATFAAPEVLADFVLAWRTSEPDALIAGLRNVFEIAAVGSVLWVAFKAINGYRFGFCNQYAKAVARMIRQRCHTPTDGEIRLTRWSRVASERMAAAER